MKDILSANCRRWWANIRSTPQKNKGLFCMIVERAFGVTLSQALSRDANRKWLLSLRNNNLSRSTTVLIIRSHYNALVLCVCVCCFIVFFWRVHLNSVTPTVPHSELRREERDLRPFESVSFRGPRFELTLSSLMDQLWDMLDFTCSSPVSPLPQLISCLSLPNLV